MSRFALVHFACLMALLVPLQVRSAGAAPANDLCSSPQIVTAGSYAGTTIDGTRDIATLCSVGGMSPDVWYSYTPATTGFVDVFVWGPGMDTVLSVHSDCTGLAGTVLGCSDDGGGENVAGSTSSEVAFFAIAGTTYLIRVAGFENSAGDFRISISEPNSLPASDCGNVRNFPSARSVQLGGGSSEFTDETQTAPFWSADSGDMIAQTFAITDRPLYFEMFLDLYVVNLLSPDNALTFNVKVGGNTIGQLTVNAGEPSGRRKSFYSFSGQTGSIEVKLEAANTLPSGGGSVLFGYAGEKASYIEFHGIPYTTVEETSNGTYNNLGAHDATSSTVLVGHDGTTPAIDQNRGYFLFNPGPARATKAGELRLHVAQYASPEPTETIEVRAYIFSPTDLTAGHPSGEFAGVLIYDNLGAGVVIGSAVIKPSDEGKIVTIQLSDQLGFYLKDYPASFTVGLRLISRNHPGEPALSEYVFFGALISTHELVPHFCPEAEPGEIYAVDQSGSIFKIDPPNNDFQYIGPLGDSSTDLEYDPINDRLLAFEGGLRELRPVDIQTYSQGSPSSTNTQFGSFEFALGQLYGLTNPPDGASVLYTIDPGGSPQPASVPPLPLKGSSLALDRSSGYFFTVQEGLSGYLYKFNPFHNDPNNVLVGATLRQIGSIEFSDAGALYAGGIGADAGKIFQIDPASGGTAEVMTVPFGPITGMCKVRSPINRRAQGDYDSDFCTGLTDFLTLLDNWQQPYPPPGDPVIGINDFLSLLDNWQLGTNC